MLTAEAKKPKMSNKIPLSLAPMSCDALLSNESLTLSLTMASHLKWPFFLPFLLKMGFLAPMLEKDKWCL